MCRECLRRVLAKLMLLLLLRELWLMCRRSRSHGNHVCDLCLARCHRGSGFIGCMLQLGLLARCISTVLRLDIAVPLPPWLRLAAVLACCCCSAGCSCNGLIPRRVSLALRLRFLLVVLALADSLLLRPCGCCRCRGRFLLTKHAAGVCICGWCSAVAAAFFATFLAGVFRDGRLPLVHRGAGGAGSDGDCAAAAGQRHSGVRGGSLGFGVGFGF